MYLSSFVFSIAENTLKMSVQFKAFLYEGRSCRSKEVRRFSIDHDVSASYEYLRRKVSQLPILFRSLFELKITIITSVPSRVRNLRKMRNFWANFTDCEPKINIIKCKTEKLYQKTSVYKYFNARNYSSGPS